MAERVVLDTNVVVSAMLSGGGASRRVLRLCLQRDVQSVVGDKLLAEYEEILGRPGLMDSSPLTPSERQDLLDALLDASVWTRVSFLWRPNLKDEGDNHVFELAIAASAGTLITHNVRDFAGGELKFPQLRIESPGQFLANWRRQHGNHDR